MSSKDFYLNLSPIADFNSVVKEDAYVLVPEGWSIIITDIKGSTEAIDQGRYRDVNKIGAATIAAVQNSLKTDFPFVFGGDGATFVLANEDIPKVKDALLGVRNLSIENFQLSLRIGIIKLEELYSEGASL